MQLCVAASPPVSSVWGVKVVIATTHDGWTEEAHDGWTEEPHNGWTEEPHDGWTEQPHDGWTEEPLYEGWAEETTCFPPPAPCAFPAVV